MVATARQVQLGRMVWIRIGLTLASLFVTECSGVDGPTTFLQPETVAFRLGLDVRSPTAPIRLTYHGGVSCRYVVTILRLEGTRPEDKLDYEVHTKAVYNRVLVTDNDLSEPNDRGSMLLDERGHLYDETFQGGTADSRHGPEDVAERKARLVTLPTNPYANRGGTLVPDGTVFEPSRVMFPEYTGQSFLLGKTVGLARQTTGEPYAYYEFKGITQYRGAAVAVLDEYEYRPARVLVGFNLVDLATSLPLFAIQDGGTRVQFAQSECDKG